MLTEDKMEYVTGKTIKTLREKKSYDAKTAIRHDMCFR